MVEKPWKGIEESESGWRICFQAGLQLRFWEAREGVLPALELSDCFSQARCPLFALLHCPRVLQIFWQRQKVSTSSWKNRPPCQPLQAPEILHLGIACLLIVSVSALLGNLIASLASLLVPDVLQCVCYWMSATYTSYPGARWFLKDKAGK